MTTSQQAGVTAAAEALRDTVTARDWLASGLRTDTGTAALDATMRPVDAIAAAGLDWLMPMVQPLQDVLDRLAGDTSAIWSFADAWQRASATVEQVGQRFSRSASTAGEQWHGTAADRYLDRAAKITESLHGSATTFRALGTIATIMGEAAAGARTQANDLVTDLVARLIPYVGQATAVEGGLTANVMTQATSMINSYAAPIADIERKLAATITNLQPLLTDGAAAGAMAGQTTRGIAPAPEAPQNPQQSRPAAPQQPERPPANDNEPGRRPPSLPRLPGPGAIVGFLARRALGVIGLLILLDEMLAERNEILPMPPAAPPGTPAPSPDDAPEASPLGDPAQEQPGDVPPAVPPGTPPAPEESPPQQQPTMEAEAPDNDPAPENEPTPGGEPDPEPEPGAPAQDESQQPGHDLAEEEKRRQEEEMWRAMEDPPPPQVAPSERSDVVKERFRSPEDAMGWEVAGQRLQELPEESGPADNPGLHAQGFTRKQYYQDEFGDKWSVHYNPTTGEYTAGKRSSSEDDDWYR